MPTNMRCIALTILLGVATAPVLAQDPFAPPYRPCLFTWPQVPGSWRVHSPTSLPFLSVRLPPSAVPDGALAASFSVPPSDSGPAFSTGHISLELSESLADTSWVDGVPVTRYGRGSHSPSDLTSCRTTIGDHQAIIVTGKNHGWGNAYFMEVILQQGPEDFLHVTFSAGTWASYVALHPLVPSLMLRTP